MNRTLGSDKRLIYPFNNHGCNDLEMVIRNELQTPQNETKCIMNLYKVFSNNYQTPKVDDKLIEIYWNFLSIVIVKFP